MNPGNPRVFIGITTYNHQDYVVPCLESIFNQSYKNINVVISDDNSKDRTVEVIEKYLKENPQFSAILIKNDPNLGISKNVNLLISKISDEKYVSLFSGDDIMFPERIALQVDQLENDPDASFCYSDMEWFLSSTNQKIVNHYGLLNRPSNDLKDLLVENSIPSPTLMYRQSLMAGILYDESLKYINDHMFVIELLSRGKGIFIDKPLVRYRKHSTGASVMQTFYSDRLRLLEILKSRFSSQYPTVIKKYSKFVDYSRCLELQKQGKKKEAFRYFISTFPASISSLKWFGRATYMIMGFFR